MAWPLPTTFVYEPEYFITGWFEDGGMSMAEWYDRDLIRDPAKPAISLFVLEFELFSDVDVIYMPPPITVEITAGLFIDEDMFFSPISVRALTQPDQMLKNEVRRIR